jgi:hypothetical protein
MTREYNHYFKPVAGLTHVDVYRVLQLFGVTDPCLQHAIKKLLVAGGRGTKDITKDVREAIVSLERWHEMREEDKQPTMYPLTGKKPAPIVADIFPIVFCMNCRLTVSEGCSAMGCPVLPCDSVPDCRYFKDHEGACKPKLPAGK